MVPQDVSNSYEHLRLECESDVTERHRRQDRRPRFRPENPRDFGANLSDRFYQARRQLDNDLGGFDDRKLLKIVLRGGEALPDFESIPGIEFVSQENQTVVLAFATDEGMAEFESRLATLSRNGSVTRAQLLYAIEGFDHWTSEDRTGFALRNQGYPDVDPFVLDVELWPQQRDDLCKLMLDRFLEWLSAVGIQSLDRLMQPSLIMVKVRCTRSHAEELLLQHRDIRTVDLPPRIGVTTEILRTDIEHLPAPASPGAHAPAVTVLDSGLTSGHPLIGPAVGDSQEFVQPGQPGGDTDSSGHGTFVSGIALYGDVAKYIEQGHFVPSLRLYAGRVFKDDDTDETRFVASAVAEAVHYFAETYGCRVFNLSYGDLNKVYDGRHLRGLAYTLDRIARSQNVLFVTSTGNRTIASLPENLREAYPEYLFEHDGRLLDPGTALNAVTVGGLVEYDASREGQRYPHDLEGIRVAQPGQPSPITRCGPSVGGAIKPDFVEHAGNVALSRSGRPQTYGLGVVSFSNDYTSGRLFADAVGVSCAAPVVAHKAARILEGLPDASANLLRALLGAHATWPQGCMDLLDPNHNDSGRTRLLHAVGYGRINEEALYRSLNNTVTLIAEEKINSDCHHFFEIPTPRTWWEGRRHRFVTVSLAYAPEVCTTRLDYRASRLTFSFVTANELGEVATAFRRNREEGMPERGSNRWISSAKRNRGTLQVSRWGFGGPINQQKLFVVVTRQDASWSPVRELPEDYALCVVLDDRERADAYLYADVRALLQARAQVRIRV